MNELTDLKCVMHIVNDISERKKIVGITLRCSHVGNYSLISTHFHRTNVRFLLIRISLVTYVVCTPRDIRVWQFIFSQRNEQRDQHQKEA